MIQQENTNIERLIAKLDNDFNLDNSDWIPRIAAWAIEAMGIIGIVPTERKRRNIAVVDRIARFPCDINTRTLKVYDGQCEIPVYKGTMNNECCSSTGEDIDSYPITPTIDVVNNTSAAYAPNEVAITRISKDYNERYNVHEIINREVINKGYIVVNCKTIELTYDAKLITIEYDSVITVKSEIYHTELPVIPNNDLVLEAIANYCMYKILCRGYKHPVFNLSASQYGTNPFYNWTILKDKAKISLIIQQQGKTINDNDAWKSAFYIFTFNDKP